MDRETDPELVPVAGDVAPLPRWAQADVAWPVSLVAGFGGAWVGISTTVPGLGAVLAGLLFAPLFMPLLERRERWLAALCSVGWALGIAGAVVGMVLESSFDEVASAIPGARTWAAAEVRRWVADGGAGADGGSAPWGPAHSAAAVLVLAAVSRPAVGLLGLPAVALAISAVAAGAGWFAQRASEAGAAPILAAFAATPPHAAVLVAALLLLKTALAEPGSPWRPPPAERGRLQLLAAGAICAALGLVLEAALGDLWGEWLAAWLR